MTNYEFSDGVRNQARRLAKPFTKEKYIECHHLVAKEIAHKYNLRKEIITSIDNCIAIEVDLHHWLHGARFCEADRKCDWKGLEEEDYIFLAIAYLGIDPKYFEE